MNFKAMLVPAGIVATIAFLLYKQMKFNSPTKPLRRRKCDGFGCGEYGASRGNRKHKGIDLLVNPGADIFAPISGKIRFANPYSNDTRFKGVEISSALHGVKLFYFLPSVKNGEMVKAGQRIGKAQNLGIKYPGIPNHIHLEVRVSGVSVDPDKYFLPDSFV